MSPRGLNKVMIIGNLEREPELRYTPGGRPVTSFSVATTHNWVTSEGTHNEETEWFNVVAWGELARICHSRLHRDTRVYVEGRLKTRSWEDGGGKRHFRTEIVARDIIVLTGDPDGDSLADRLDPDSNDMEFNF
jgi:single-strand DNA-binding protein